MLTVVERQIKHSGVKFVVIDNMMSALARYSEGGELYGAQAELALHLNFFARNMTLQYCCVYTHERLIKLVCTCFLMI